MRPFCTLHPAQESAASARSCDSELGELAVSAGAVARSVGRCALWVLIAAELAAHAGLSALVVALSPLLRGISVSSARAPACPILSGDWYLLKGATAAVCACQGTLGMTGMPRSALSG